MPHHLEDTILPSTKGKKSCDKKSSSKKCKKPTCSSSSSSSCTEECIDCCTPQFIRLNRFAASIDNYVLTGAANELFDTPSGATGSATTTNIVQQIVNNGWSRCGTQIAPPNGVTGATNLVTYPFNNSLAGVYFGASNTVALDTITPGVTGGASAALTVTPMFVANLNALLSYYFVNEFQYVTNESGCKSDQVYGWLVNTSTPNIQLYSAYDTVPVTVTLQSLLALTATTITSTTKKQLKTLNTLYKLSTAAIKKVNATPATEGNIVQVCDCKGNQWLVYINLANSFKVNVLCPNTQFTIVACKL